MFLKERQDAIVQAINESGRVTVAGLAERFGVTQDCIRKDLKQLDREGMLRRVYGGAISIAYSPEHSVKRRLDVHLDEKRAIAHKAYEQIVPGETIFIDISTTNLALAELLARGKKRCVVMSNMIDTLQTLASNPLLTVIGTGGNVNQEFNGFLGATTLSALEPVYFDKAFLGAFGVDLDHDAVTTFDADDSLVKQLVIRNSAHSYLLVDTHKFGARGSHRYASLEDFDIVFTDAPTPKLRGIARNHGTQLA